MIENPIEKIDSEEWLAQYKDHLEKTCGLASATQRSYMLIARRFLARVSRKGHVKFAMITPAAVIRFVRADAAPRKGQGPNTTAAATKSVLRFLISQGFVQAHLEEIVPRVRCYRHSALPACLSETEVEQVLSFSKDGTANGHRNFALVLLFSRLGIRVDEAARLMLDDVDWVNGFVIIRAGKNRCERKLPLAQDLAEAILQYLRLSRPVTDNRHIFLKWAPPFNEYCADSLGKVIKRLLVGAGIQRLYSGPHLFRHSAATKMVNQGASFKEIADLFGHHSLETTAIYAKLDFNNLAKIALPWPGGDQ